MRARTRQAGFTLIELLVGMALTGVVLLVVNQTLNSTVRGTGVVNSQGALQQESLNGQYVIAARLKEAWYVYPAGSTLAFANNALIRNPVTGTSTFTVGTHPVLAMILPPPVRGAACVPNTAVNTGCYRFYTYYGMARSAWVAAASGFKDPGTTVAAANTWVLAEYRADYAAAPTITATAPAIPASAPDGSGINLLSESVAPALGGAAPDYQLFTLGSSATLTPGQLTGWPTPYVNQVQLELRVTQASGGRTLTLPSAAGTYSLSIYPENLGAAGL